MNRDMRYESRCFFPNESTSLVCSRLESLALQQRFAEPITATVYFLPIQKRKLPQGMYVRLRFYRMSLEQVLKFSGGGFLEVKYTNDSGLVVKNRWPVDITDAFSVLINGLSIKFTPMIAMQVQRSHWLVNNVRLTVDHDIRIFGFLDPNVPEAQFIGVLDEDKLEIKSNIPHDLERWRGVLLDGIVNHAEVSTYLERRLRECYGQWKATLVCN